MRPSPLRLRRVVRGLRLADVRAAVGILEVSISKMERGELALRGLRLRRLAAFYKCSETQLVHEMERWCTRNNRRFLGPGDHIALDVEEPPETAV